MLWIIGGIGATIYGLITLITTYIGVELYHSSGSLSPFSILFLLSPLNTKVLYNTLLLKILISTLTISILCLFISSNHFLISLDILCLFTMLILTFLKTSKISKSPA